jgi:hypothetical protein
MPKMESEMKKRNVFFAVLIVLALLVMTMPIVALADGNGPNPSPVGANHGAFANTNGNFGWLGELGGTPGYHNGAVGQQEGATGYNNSAGAPWGGQN